MEEGNGGNELAKRPVTGTPRRTLGGLSPKFKRISELYRQFGEEWKGLDWSDQALIDMYNSESHGTEIDRRTNGFYIGKQWMGVTISMWKEDIQKGYLTRSELYNDPRLPHWWLDQVL